MGTQIGRYADHLCVAAVRSNAIARLKMLDRLTAGEDNARRAVAHRHRFAQFLLHLANRCEEALIADLF